MSSKRNLLSYKVKRMSEVQTKARQGIESLEAIIMNFYTDVIEEYGSFMAALQTNVHR